MLLEQNRERRRRHTAKKRLQSVVQTVKSPNTLEYVAMQLMETCPTAGQAVSKKLLTDAQEQKWTALRQHEQSSANQIQSAISKSISKSTDVSYKMLRENGCMKKETEREVVTKKGHDKLKLREYSILFIYFFPTSPSLYLNF